MKLEERKSPHSQLRGRNWKFGQQSFKQFKIDISSYGLQTFQVGNPTKYICFLIFIFVLLTNSLNNRPSKRTCTPQSKDCSLFRNKSVHYHTRKSPPLDPLLSQLNAVSKVIICFHKSHINFLKLGIYFRLIDMHYIFYYPLINKYAPLVEWY